MVILKKIVYTNNAPKPVGPYSQAVCVNGWLYVSGQIPIDPATGELVKGDFKAQVERVLTNIRAIVESAGGTLNDVVKVTVFLRDMSRIGEFNEVYSKFFVENPPARSVVGVNGIPRGAELEVEAVAWVKECS
ncbi:MAG: RidA family protein [Desulfurococcaceae archaeon]